MPNSPSAVAASCMTVQSESEPMTTPTSGIPAASRTRPCYAARPVDRGCGAPAPLLPRRRRNDFSTDADRGGEHMFECGQDGCMATLTDTLPAIGDLSVPFVPFPAATLSDADLVRAQRSIAEVQRRVQAHPRGVDLDAGGHLDPRGSYP